MIRSIVFLVLAAVVVQAMDNYNDPDFIAWKQIEYPDGTHLPNYELFPQYEQDIEEGYGGDGENAQEKRCIRELTEAFNKAYRTLEAFYRNLKAAREADRQARSTRVTDFHISAIVDAVSEQNKEWKRKTIKCEKIQAKLKKGLLSDHSLKEKWYDVRSLRDDDKFVTDNRNDHKDIIP